MTATITVNPMGRTVRATVSLYSMGRPVCIYGGSSLKFIVTIDNGNLTVQCSTIVQYYNQTQTMFSNIQD